MRLNPEQFNQLFINLYHAIIRDDATRIVTLLHGVETEDQISILTAQCNVFYGTLPFFACVHHGNVMYSLLKNLPEEHHQKVLSVKEDGNTALTEAIEWRAKKSIEGMLMNVSKETRKELLTIQNSAGETAHSLLAPNENEIRNMKEAISAGFGLFKVAKTYHVPKNVIQYCILPYLGDDFKNISLSAYEFAKNKR